MIWFLVGLLIGLSVAPLRAWRATRRVVPVSSHEPRYVITSNGLVVWSGDDGTAARNRWELTTDGTFHDTGILRGTR